MGSIAGITGQLNSMAPCTSNNCCDQIAALNQRISALEGNGGIAQNALQKATQALGEAGIAKANANAIAGDVDILQSGYAELLALVGAAYALARAAMTAVSVLGPLIASIQAAIATLAASLASLSALVAPLIVAVAGIAALALTAAGAQIAADAAYALANTVLQIASSAGDRAATAILRAGAADSKATAAGSAAAAAGNAAGAADSKAAAAGSAAAAAGSAAAAADSKATAASSAAAAAGNAAAAADSKATAASSAAAAAGNAAAAADSKATAAGSAAAAADTKAIAAGSAAAAADAKAIAADAKATVSGNLATTASTKASSADTKADTAIAIATAANNKIAIPGSPGLTGSPGLKGDRGETGIQGLPGTAGSIGQTGARGLPGLPGSIGQTGARGLPGLPGSIGQTGAQGLPGTAADPTIGVRVGTLENKMDKVERRPEILPQTPDKKIPISFPGTGEIIKVPTDDYIQGEFVEKDNKIAKLGGDMEPLKNDNNKNKAAILVIQNTCCQPETKTQPKVEFVPTLLRKFERCDPDTRAPVFSEEPNMVIKELVLTERLKADKIADIQAQQCKELTAIATVPEWWQMRPEATRPQAILVFKEVRPDGTIGNDPYAITIPHCTLTTAPNSSPLITYKKGSVQGILTLKDNSKLIINCKDKQECDAVFTALSAVIDSNQLEGSSIKISNTKGIPFKEIEVKAQWLHYYPNGAKTMKPAYIKSFF